MAELPPGIVNGKKRRHERTAEIATVGTPPAQIKVDTHQSLTYPIRELGDAPRR